MRAKMLLVLNRNPPRIENRRVRCDPMLAVVDINRAPWSYSRYTDFWFNNHAFQLALLTKESVVLLKTDHEP